MSPSVSARWYGIATAGLALLAACSSSMETIVPQGITVTPPTLSFSSKGATQQLTATVTDQHGNTIRNATVTWSSNNAAVASVTSSGLAASVGNGTTQIVAAAGVVTATVTVTVAQVATAMIKIGGDNQTAPVGTQLPQPLVVQVSDALGNPAATVSVSFAVTSGGGSVTVLSASTDASGNASTQWTIGTSTTVLERVTASSGVGAQVFSATATAGAPKSVAKQAGDNQLVATGTAAPIRPSVLVQDQFSNPVPNATVTFSPGMLSGSVSGGTVLTTGAGLATVGGWTVNANPGTDTLYATVTGSGVAGNPARFLATAATPGPPASVAVQAGDGQTGLDGYALNFNPAVVVHDMSGLPVANAQVTFMVTAGGGSVTGGTPMTGTDGVATVGSWTIGKNPGSNTLTGTVTGSGITGNPVTFTATGQAAAYTIDVRYLSTISITRKMAFDSAAAFWMRIIYGDVGAIPLNIPAGTCGRNSPAMNETVPGVVIFATLDSIDGPGKTIAQSGPCWIRASSSTACAPNCKPIVGIMYFDTADVVNIEKNGQWPTVVLHEMGHVLGFGTIWSNDQFGLNLLVGPTYQGGTDPHFVGSQALAAFDRIGGTSYTGGAKVPVENCCVPGGGTNDGHWRYSVFGNELMTSFINTVTKPLSVLTIASMGDEGYTVNYAAAQPYTHTFSLLAAPVPAASTLHLENDIVNLPIYMVDRTGRVTGVLRR